MTNFIEVTTVTKAKKEIDPVKGAVRALAPSNDVWQSHLINVNSIKMIRATIEKSQGNTIILFSDNASLCVQESYVVLRNKILQLEEIPKMTKD